MGAVGAMFLLCGLFFLYKTFTAPNLLGTGRRRLSLFGDNAGKVDCGMVAALMLFWAFVFFWNM